MTFPQRLKACTIDKALRDPVSLVVSIAYAAMFLGVLPINSAVSGMAGFEAQQSLPYVFAAIGVLYAVTLLGLRLFHRSS